MSSRYRSHAVNGRTRIAPEMRCMPEHHAVIGNRISNRSANRLRYFGRGFFATALDIGVDRAGFSLEAFPPKLPRRFHYSVAAQQLAAVKSKSDSLAISNSAELSMPKA